ncbi:MAG: hypothetical protein ACXVA6_05065 [Isosphaeraceae bacterium]
MKPDPGIRIPATFYPRGLDETVRYRFEEMTTGHLPGVNGHLEVSRQGIGWIPNPHSLRHFEPWTIPWSEIESLEAVGAFGRPIASDLRLTTIRGVVEFWVTSVDVDPLVKVVAGYLDPGDAGS